MNHPIFLAADIGATKTNIGLYTFSERLTPYSQTVQYSVTLSAAKKDVIGNRAIIAPGSCLGESFLTWDGKKYASFASEGGHGDFAPNSQIECDLLLYLQKEYGHVSYERVCSGQGIYNIYRFLKDQKVE